MHLLLRFKPSWVVPDVRAGDLTFDDYPKQSLEEWHREKGLWVD